MVLGFCTAKGELVRSILFPKPTEFRFSQDAFKFVGVLFLLSLFGIGYTFAVMVRTSYIVVVGYGAFLRKRRKHEDFGCIDRENGFEYHYILCRIHFTL